MDQDKNKVKSFKFVQFSYTENNNKRIPYNQFEQLYFQSDTSSFNQIKEQSVNQLINQQLHQEKLQKRNKPTMPQNTTSNNNINNITWYSNVYYSYRDYPVKQLNVKYKKSELKGVYNSLMRKMFGSFQIKIFNSNADDEDKGYHGDGNSHRGSFEGNGNEGNMKEGDEKEGMNDHELTGKSNSVSGSSQQISSNQSSSQHATSLRKSLSQNGDNTIKMNDSYSKNSPKSEVSFQYQMNSQRQQKSKIVKENNANNMTQSVIKNDSKSNNNKNKNNSLNKGNNNQQKSRASVKVSLKSQGSIQSSLRNNMIKSKKQIELINQSNNSIPQSFANKESVKRTKMREQQERQYRNSIKRSPSKSKGQSASSKLQSPQSYSSQSSPRVNQSFSSSTININQIHNKQSSHLFTLQQSNMSVFYQLMVKMIPLTLKRITVEIDQEVKEIKEREHKIEVINQIDDRYEEGESSVGNAEELEEEEWQDKSQSNNQSQSIPYPYTIPDRQSTSTFNQPLKKHQSSNNNNRGSKDKKYTLVVSYAGKDSEANQQEQEQGNTQDNKKFQRRGKNEHHPTYSAGSYHVNNEFNKLKGNNNNNRANSNYELSNPHTQSNNTNGLNINSSINTKTNNFNNNQSSNPTTIYNYPIKPQQSNQRNVKSNSSQRLSLSYSSLTDINYPETVEEVKFYFLQYSLDTQVVYSGNKGRESVGNNNNNSRNYNNNFSNISINSNSSSKKNILHGGNRMNSLNLNNNRANTNSSLSSIQQQQHLHSHSAIQTAHHLLTLRVSQMPHQHQRQQSLSQIQSLVMKYSTLQIKSFNLFLNHFYSKIEQASALVNVIGFDNIAESICQMAMGREARNNGIKTQFGLSNMKIRSFTNFLNQQNHNILLTTWVDLILYTCQPQALYNITQSLNKDNLKLSSQPRVKRTKKAWTPSIGSSSSSKRHDTNKNERQSTDFKQKMLSLLNFMILNTTKNILLESITKANFLSVVMVEMLANRHDNRSLKDFQLRPLTECEISTGINRDRKCFLEQDQAIVVYDLRYRKQLWVKQAIDLIYSKWRKVVEIIFEQQVKNENIYWQLVFQKCASLINRQLSLLTVLVFNLVQVIENITAVIERINNQLFQKSKMTKQAVHNKKRQLADYKHVRASLQHIVKDIIGCPQIFTTNQAPSYPHSRYHHHTNNKHRQFSRIQHGLKLVNRQQHCKQLTKWQQIMKENILIIQSYISNLQIINKIFNHHSYHVALWFISFDKQTRVLIKKVKRQNLELFFEKFYQKIPKQWSSLNYEEKQQQLEQQQQQNHMLLSALTSYKRASFMSTGKKRISSIKGKQELTSQQKQALILNYMIKSELELYQSYTKSHISNCRQLSTTMTTIITSNIGGGRRANHPFLLQDPNIESLLMFNYKNVPVKNKQRDIITNHLFVKRTQKAALTVKPLSSFAPNISLSPRALKKENLQIQPFQKRNQIGYGVTSKSKQQQKQQSQQHAQYQIDVALLQTISYTQQELQFLTQLNTHLRFINEINFEYEYYYWKTLSYDNQGNKNFSQGNSKATQQNEKQSQHTVDDNNNNNNSKPLRQSQSSDTTYRAYASYGQERKMMTLNEYTKQKTQNLLNTQQLYLQFEKINHIMEVSRPVQGQLQFIRYGIHVQSGDSSQKDDTRSLYNQKINEFISRLKVHNQSLVMIVNAALSAKNYWKALSSNVFPQDQTLTKNKKQHTNSTHENSNTIINIQSNHQERFFCNKILNKIQQYINYYREISQQMEYDFQEGRFVNAMETKRAGERIRKNDDHDREGNHIREPVVEQQQQGKQSITNKDNLGNNNNPLQKLLNPLQQLLTTPQQQQQQNKRQHTKKPSILQSIQLKNLQKARMFSLLEGLISRNSAIKRNRFQIAGEIYQYSQKILLLNCYMASFYIDRLVYLQIISQNELTQQKYSKVKIIGKQYFQKIKNYSTEISMEKDLTEDNLKNTQLIYQKKVLILLVSLMELLYYGNEQANTLVGKWRYSSHEQKQSNKTAKSLGERLFERGYKNHAFKINRSNMNKYSSLLKKFLKYRLSQNTFTILTKQNLTREASHFTNSNSNTNNQHPTHDYTYISKILSQMLQFNETTQQVTEQQFISTLITLRNQQNDESFLKFFIHIIQKQTSSLQEYDNNQAQKVSCLKKKFTYLILRQVYFFLHYDIDCLQQKSAYSKKNYQMYENRVLDFYQQIITKNYHDFVIKKQLQLKKRSVYLQNYLMKYEQQPNITSTQKSLNKLIVCVFNQILLIYTQEIKMEIKKKSGQQEVLTSMMMIKNNATNNSRQLLHTAYLSSEFYQDKSLFTTNQGGKVMRKGSSLEKGEEKQKQGKVALYNEVDIERQGMVMKQNERSPGKNNNNNSFLASFLSGLVTAKNNKQQQQSQQQSLRSSLQSSNLNASLNSPLYLHKTFKVFTLQSMNLHEAINIYQSIKHLSNESLSKHLNQLKQIFTNTNSHRRDDLTQMEITTLTINQESIVSLLKRQIIQAINQLKFNLVQKNLISRIQKLYINLDVRHKVFQSFKEKILSYEMQKAKIYHQYMDYIRGLKLDVYSHIANEDSLPYIKILHAIKLYRLEVKKQQLQNKVRQQFGKNLKKWNQGIQMDLVNYQQWLESEEHHWDNTKVNIAEQKQKYLLVYDSIRKELKRQTKKKEIEEQQKLKRSSQNLKRPIEFTLTDSKALNLSKSTNEIKKITASKKNAIEFNKSITPKPEINQVQPITKHIYKRTPSNLTMSQVPQILFMAQKKQQAPNEMLKCNSLHNIMSRSISKQFVNEKKQIQRPTTSMNNSEYYYVGATTMKSKSKDFNRASTAVTREKSLDLQTSQFRGIKMKFNSKSTQKFANYDEFPKQELKHFKRSSLKPQHIQRMFSSHLGQRKEEKSLREIQSNQTKSKKLIKQGRTINSALLPDRKVFMKNI